MFEQSIFVFRAKINFILQDEPKNFNNADVLVIAPRKNEENLRNAFRSMLFENFVF